LETLYIGHSPDADDAFMFYALANGSVKIGDYKIDHVMEDIESLNHKASTGELPVTAISAAVYPQVADKYRIMSCGSSIGRNYGPLLLSKETYAPGDLGGKRIGIPGEFTTAYMLMRIFVTADFVPVIMDFDKVMDAAQSGEIDAGVIIHEGQLTWNQTGLNRVLDLGEEWMKQTGLPIPLGLDVIHRKFSDDEAKTIARALKESIVYARTNEEDAIDYALQFGRGVDRDTCREFVRMYVNEDTVDMGDEGRRALETLYSKAVERGILDKIPTLDIIQV